MMAADAFEAFQEVCDTAAAAAAHCLCHNPW